VDGGSDQPTPGVRARCFRGLELILRGRDPREAWIWAQRICGVCNSPRAGLGRAVEDALEIEDPDNARLVRKTSRGTRGFQDHVVHFFITCMAWTGWTRLGVEADPAKTFDAGGVDPIGRRSSTKYFKGVLDKPMASVRAKSSASSARAIGATRRITCRRRRT